MLFAIYIALIAVLLLFPSSKKAFGVMLTYMWFLSSFCGDNADYTIYRVRYMGYQNSANVLESGFSLLVKICHMLHFDFRMFLIVTYAIIYSILAWFVLKNIKNPNMFLVPYSISVFFIDYLQIRNYIAFSFVLIGLHYFMKGNTYKANMTFMVCVVIASLFHFACIFYLVFLIGRVIDINTLFFCVLSFDIVGMVLLRSNIVFLISKLLIGERKARQILNFNTNLVAGADDATKFIMKYYLVIGITCCVMFVVSLLVRNHKPRASVRTSINNILTQSLDSERIIYLRKVILICLLVLPALLYNVEIYRLQRNSVMIFYVLIAMCYNVSGKRSIFWRDREGSLCIKVNINYAVLLMGSLVVLFVQVYKLATFEKTATALFENNVIFN